MHRCVPSFPILRMIRLAMGVALLTGFVASLILVQPGAPRETPPAVAASAIQGVWQGSNRDGTGPFSPEWLVLQMRGSNEVRLSWKQDGFCSYVDTLVFGSELQVVDHTTGLTFTVLDPAMATATIHRGDQTWIQRYHKRSATIPACDWLLQSD